MNTSKLNILVIDDTQAQLDLAIRLLGGHTVTTANGYAAAKAKLCSKPGTFDNPNGYDVVLTDMMMPGEREGLGDTSLVGKLVPYGFNVAMLALRCGAEKVAVVSNGQGDDGNHHQHPVLWACDDINGFGFEDRLMFFTGYKCPYMAEGRLEVEGNNSPYNLKDWGKVLETLLGGGAKGK